MPLELVSTTANPVLDCVGVTQATALVWIHSAAAMVRRGTEDPAGVTEKRHLMSVLCGKCVPWTTIRVPPATGPLAG